MDDYWSNLERGVIIGIIDSYGVIHSKFSLNLNLCHADIWATSRINWRWDIDKSIWWIGGFENRPNEEEYISIQTHITKKYRIKFWKNGHSDIDFFYEQLEAEKTQNEKISNSK